VATLFGAARGQRGGARTVALAVCAASVVAALVLAQESRRIRRIPVPATPAAGAALNAGNLPELPDSDQVEAAVRQIASSYGSERLADFLAQDFPNREEVLDTLRRVGQQATSIELYIESVEGVQIGPWQRAGDPAGGAQPIASVCVADVRTRLAFDDPTTGQRTVRPVGRGQWQVRFTAELEQ